MRRMSRAIPFSRSANDSVESNISKEETHNVSNFFSSIYDPFAKAKKWGTQKFEAGALKNKKEKADADRKLTFLMLYTAFLLAYSITAMYGRNNSSIYYMQRAIVDEIAGTKIAIPNTGYNFDNSRSSGYSGNMTLTEIRRVTDMWTWMRTSFHHSLYSNNFDGDPSYKGTKRSFLMGQNMLLGGVRISQYRINSKDCESTSPVGLTEGYISARDPDASGRWTCFSGIDTESQRNFANNTYECDDPDFNWQDPPTRCDGKGPTTYVYKPDKRTRSQNLMLSSLGYEYPSPGFYKTLPNNNGTQASFDLATLYQSKFVDLSTRALFVDLSFWNLNLERLITVKIIFEMPTYGGVEVVYQARVADIYNCSPLNLEICATSDYIRMAFELICLFAIICVTVVVFLQVWFNFFRIFAWNYGCLHMDPETDSLLTAFKSSLINGERVELDDEGNPVDSKLVNLKTLTKKSSFINGAKVKEGYHTPKELTESQIVTRNLDSSSLFQKLVRITFARPSSFWFWNAFLVFQILVYSGYLVSQWIAYDLIPTNYNVAGDTYIDFQTPCLWINYADRLNALFIFLSWVRLFEFITYFSGHGLLLFVFMLLVFLCGSALSNQIALGFYVEDYSSFSSSFFTTAQALRGTLPFDEMRRMFDSSIWGTTFAFIYVIILMYILIHLLLAVFFALGQYMKTMFQLSLEENIEETRQEILHREDPDPVPVEFDVEFDVDVDVDLESAAAFSATTTSSLSVSSFSSSEEEILNQRRQERRARRRTERHSIWETGLIYVGVNDTNPIAAAEAANAISSDSSLGDLVELDYRGNVLHQTSFFNPPPLPCRKRPLKFNQNKFKKKKEPGRRRRRERGRGRRAGGGLQSWQFDGEKMSLAERAVSEEEANDEEEEEKERSVIASGNEDIDEFNDSLMSMIMGGGDANSAENIVDGARDSVMSKMNDMMNSVGDAVGGSGGGDGGETGGGIGKYFNMFSSMMSTNGSYGVKQHVAKETQRRASFSSSLPGDGIEIQKILVKQVMQKIRLFTDMSVAVGEIFDTAKERVLKEAEKLFEIVDKRTGQIDLNRVWVFLSNIGMDVTNMAKETLQAIFARDLENVNGSAGMERFSDSNHSCLTMNGMNVEKPHLYVDSLSIFLLAAIPLMSGNRELQSYLPRVVHLPLISDLAKDLIEHVTGMLHLENSGRGIHFADNVVTGLDRIFFMISAAFEDIIKEDWRSSAQDTLAKLQNGLHSLNANPDEAIGRAMSDFANELRETLSNAGSKEVDFLSTSNKFAHKVRRASSLGLGIDANQQRQLMGELGVSKKATFLAEQGKKNFLKLDDVVVGEGIKTYDASKKIKGDKSLQAVDDFLAQLMGEVK